MPAPLLLVDVDGVISLFGFDPTSPPPGKFLLVDGIPHLISAAAGDHLRALAPAFELAWCSGWEEKADEHLRHALQLPESCPHLTFDAVGSGSQPHWKLAAIERYAGPNRPLAWIDDAHDDACADWAAAREGPTLLVTTEPAVGITAAQVERLLAWAGISINGPR
jgi:HAD domain in Swiss Army Knife RNA repair proteins